MKLTAEKDKKTFCTPGNYIARITEIAEETLKNGNTVIRVYFQFKDTNKEPMTVTSIFPMKLTPSCKLANLLKAVGYEDIEEGYEYDLDDILGVKVRITVKNNKKDQRTYSNITSYRPYAEREEDFE